MEWFTRSVLPLLVVENRRWTMCPLPAGRRIRVSACTDDSGFVLVEVDGRYFHSLLEDVQAFCRRVPSTGCRRATSECRRALASN